MARMIPARAPDEPGSERRAFARLRDGLDDKWTILHSVGIAGHAQKPWAEIDFVAIGPPGVFCLEVKGGQVSRENGIWSFGGLQKFQSPFDQVMGARVALYQFLQKARPWIASRFVGAGVMFPDVDSFRVEGAGLVTEIVWDLRDSTKPLPGYFERLTDYLKTLPVYRDRYDLTELSKQERDDIVDLLRGDFDLRLSLRTRVSRANDELLRLTTEQYSVLDSLADNERLLLTGGAGTGKTMLAVEEAVRCADAGDKVLLTCFNKNLATEIAKALVEQPRIKVSGFHQLMRELIVSGGLETRLKQYSAYSPEELFGKVYPELALEAVLEQSCDGMFDVVIIDEAQDLLKSEYFDVFDALAKGGLANGRWRVFYDPLQNLYDGLQHTALEVLEKHRPAKHRLRVNCRNTRAIAVNVALLSETTYTESMVEEGPDVEFLYYRDDGDMQRKLVNAVTRLRSGGLRTDQIVVLGHQRLDKTSLRSAMPELHDSSEGSLSPGKVRYSTVHSFKGLEADAVILIGLGNLEHPGNLSAIYVGATRARSWLTLLIDEKHQNQVQQKASKFGAALVAADS